MNITKHFKSEEFACKCGCGADNVSFALVTKLETMRGILGKPIRIASGVRCAKRNAEVGGKSGSAHMTGEAADLACGGGEDTYNLVFAAYAAGIRRIGIAGGFVHVDVSETLPGPTVWTY